MALGGRFSGCLLWLGTLGIAFEAPAEEGRIRLVFDASAQGLPEDEVRAAVESELGRPVVTSGEAASGELVILVDTGHLVVRYRTELGTVERHLPTPGNVDDVPLIVSLAAGNLVRDPTVGISPRRAESTPPPEPEARDEPRAHRPPREASFARHWLGLHVAGDIAFVDSESPCGARPGPEKNFSCFYEGTDDPFFHHGQSEQATFDGGPTFATTRLLLSYDYAFEPWLSVGTRLGYAFGGGPPVGQSPVNEPPNGDPNLVPERTPGTGGTPFLPLHAELRANYWLLPLSSRSLRAYVGAGFGIAQVDSKQSGEVYDCAKTLEPSWDPTDGSFDECLLLSPDITFLPIAPTRVDAWKKMGRGFAAASAGAMLPVKGDLGVVMNVNAMAMFPATGFVLETSLGIMAGL